MRFADGADRGENHCGIARSFPGNSNTSAIDGGALAFEAMLGQTDRIRAKCVCENDAAAGANVAIGDLANSIGMVEVPEVEAFA